MKAYADTVVNALHVLLTRSPQIFDYLTLVDGDDLLRLTHGGFIQTTLLFENAVCRLAQLFQLCGKRHNDQGRSEEIAAVVLDIDNRSNAALNISAMLAQICQIDITASIVPIFSKHVFSSSCRFYVKGRDIASRPRKPLRA